MNGYIKTEKDEDCRAIPEPFLKTFMVGGLYYNFVKLVNKCTELELCFRGNAYDKNPTTGGRVCIYRDNHAVFTITPQTIYFNTAYLKYCSDGKERLNKLIKKYKFNKGNEVVYEEKVHSNNSAISRKADTEIMKDIEELYLNLLKEVFDNYLADEAQSEKKRHLEKKRQQELFRVMRYQKNGYYFYDMEFQQRHDCKSEQDIARKNGESNKPDMQAIRFGEDGIPKAIVFVEVKCTNSAYDGKSGVLKHLDGMRNYRDDFKDSRRREAFLILHQYEKLGLRSFERGVIEAEYQKLPFENIFIFTDDAKTRWDADKGKEIMEIKNMPQNQVREEILLEDGTTGLLIRV